MKHYSLQNRIVRPLFQTPAMGLTIMLTVCQTLQFFGWHLCQQVQCKITYIHPFPAVASPGSLAFILRWDHRSEENIQAGNPAWRFSRPCSPGHCICDASQASRGGSMGRMVPAGRHAAALASGQWECVVWPEHSQNDSARHRGQAYKCVCTGLSAVCAALRKECRLLTSLMGGNSILSLWSCSRKREWAP